MRFKTMLKPAMLLVMMVVLTPLLIPVGTSAEATTITSKVNACAQNVDSYSVQLQSRNQLAPAADFPATVTLHFADGTTAEAIADFGPVFGTTTYRLDDSDRTYREVPLLYATAQFDATKYRNHRFTVTAYPCDPTLYSTVSGTIVQNGNLRPVADLAVCLVELELCTTTDANGYFAFTNVDYGTYTLTSNGSVFKPLSTTVEVSWADLYLDLVQFKGGGN